MTSRFISNLTALIMGALLMADRFVFGPGPARWLAFGESCAIVVTVAVAFAVRGRGPAQRMIDVLLVLTGAWMVIASLAYSAGTAGWIALGAGGAAAQLGLFGLVAHEVVMERATRQMAVAEASPQTEETDAGPSHRAPVALASWPS